LNERRVWDEEFELIFGFWVNEIKAGEQRGYHADEETVKISCWGFQPFYNSRCDTKELLETTQ
jgi:hypothetical protein